MTQELSIPLLFLALILGIKHSLDADHVVAISSILLRSPSLFKTTTLSIAWALGHMVTASIITFIIFSFKEIFLSSILEYFEILVAIMLITIALLTFAWEFDVISFGKHSHGHIHEEEGTIHVHDNEHEEVVSDFSHGHLQFLSFKGEYATISGIGIVHGLASNDELLLLLTLNLGLDNFALMLFGVFIFTIGVVTGMIIYSTLLKLPFAYFGRERTLKVVNIFIASITLIYGFYVLFGGETINLLPFIGE